ncbi:MAG: hypothetical protein FWC38_00560 [Proteobacteria bacterium]|nr:hypothetical protein [Pseudomonadota bacterium]
MQESGIRCQMSDVRCQKSEVRGQRSGIRNPLTTKNTKATKGRVNHFADVGKMVANQPKTGVGAKPRRAPATTTPV